MPDGSNLGTRLGRAHSTELGMPDVNELGASLCPMLGSADGAELGLSLGLFYTPEKCAPVQIHEFNLLFVRGNTGEKCGERRFVNLMQ